MVKLKVTGCINLALFSEIIFILLPGVNLLNLYLLTSPT